MQKHLLQTLLFLLASFTLGAQDWPHTLDSVLHRLAADSLFDGQVLIAEEGEIQFHEAYGQHGDRNPVQTDDPMIVYSVGKSFTATAILLLEADGLLDTQDAAGQYLKGFPYPDIRIHHLLNMTSGLPRILPLAMREADTSKILSNRGMLALLAEHQPPAGEPGAAFHYNNLNYALLALIVEEVSQQPFAQFLQSRIFEPLQMQHTRETVPASFDRLRQQGIDADNFYQPFGTGSVATTAADLYRYDQALYGEELLSNTQKAKAFATTLLADSTASDYGYGWRITEGPLGKEIYHVGDGQNMRASLQRFTDQHKTLIYIHAYSNHYHRPVYWTLRNIWEGQTYEVPTYQKPYTINPKLLQQYAGSYQSSFGLVHLTVENGKLWLRPDPIPGKEELVPSSDTTFYFRNQNLEWEIFLDDDGEVIGFGLLGDRENMGRRVE